ncbi:KpsF/GutQ family sugar-phosphate isomerase [Turicimonas muris]|uniref:KpsF/GutQ family sugar-phosphate isomerase n=1 Tax=Turicimonas muris TaxID=1796652 RepID=UPI002494CA43|nr:KpsF/GutQ family sugar-phosphate isomerase [Turicimonas muris]
MNGTSSTKGIFELGKAVLQSEAQAICHLSDTLNENFIKAVQILLACKGRVVVSGVGKSGHIARKIAATLASTGTPAFFVHAAEAAHGDLGMITKEDVVIAISYSGSSSELLAIVPTIVREGTPIIAITGSDSNPLANHATVNLNIHVEREACPLNLAPTSSTTVTLALGDALAVACLDAKGFGPEDFARSHPGGALGRRLLTHVKDVMRTGDDLPVVKDSASVLDAVKEITRKKIGVTAITNEANEVVGIFTEGDLRRLIEKVGDIRPISIASVMTKHPSTTTADALAMEAAKVLETTLRNQLLVVDKDNKLIGALHIHDLMTAKVI